EVQRVSDDADMRQRALLLDPREWRGRSLPVYAELARDLDPGGQLGPDAVLERVKRPPERGVVVRSGPAVVQHRISTLSGVPSICGALDRAIALPWQRQLRALLEAAIAATKQAQRWSLIRAKVSLAMGTRASSGN